MRMPSLIRLWLLTAKDIEPTVTWGTSPQDTVGISGVVPNPDDFDESQGERDAKIVGIHGFDSRDKDEGRCG